jgi:flavin reductase (DIM6/NTAB) family NADH-FMN oxidoreductase RutF
MTELRSETPEARPLEFRQRAPGHSPRSSLVEATKFRAVVGHSPTGVSVVTTRDRHGGNHGITVSSYASLSLEPPLVLACIDRRSRIHQVLTAATSFAISILSADQEPVAHRFASRTDDRFAGIATSPGKLGNMLIAEAVAYLECVLVDAYGGGDHSIIVGAVVSAEAREGLPLLHFCGGYTEPVGRRRTRTDVGAESEDTRPATPS